MSSIGSTSYDDPKSDTQDSGASSEDLISSFMESVRDSFAALPEPEQWKLHQQNRSLLPDAQQSKPSAQDMHDRSGCFDDAADDDDNLPVFSDPQYPKILRQRWMSSATTEERKVLALEGYRSY